MSWEQLSERLLPLPLAEELAVCLADYFEFREANGKPIIFRSLVRVSFHCQAVAHYQIYKIVSKFRSWFLQGTAEDEHSGMAIAIARDATFVLPLPAKVIVARALDEAAKLCPAAEPLIVYAALLPPNPIPLFLFAEALKQFGEPFASKLGGDGLRRAVEALRNCALLDCKTISYESGSDKAGPAISTDIIQLHPLVREAALARCQVAAVKNARCALVRAIAQVYPSVAASNDVRARVRWLKEIALDLVDNNDDLPEDKRLMSIKLLLLTRIASHSEDNEAERLYTKALFICERMAFPIGNQFTAAVIMALANIHKKANSQFSLEELHERALEALGPQHPVVKVVYMYMLECLEAHARQFWEICAAWS